MYSSSRGKRNPKMKILPLFSFSLVFFCCLASFLRAYSNKSRFNWLEAGTYATYSFGALKDGQLEPTFLGFDDCGSAILATGNYSWRCIEIEGGNARLEVEINLLINGSVSYYGREFVERAENGDLSFIKRIPMEQVVGRIQLRSDMVRISGPIYIHKNLVVTVDLNTLELVDEDDNPWGKWAMWIDPLKYPLEGNTLETFIMNWLNTTVDLYVGYNDGSHGPPMETVLGRFERYFSAGHSPIENEFLSKLGIMNPPAIILTYTYHPRSGIFLKSEMMYIDDVLTQKLGVILTMGTFILSDTNVQIEQDSRFNFTPFIPYLAILSISGIIAGAYLINKKRHSFSKHLSGTCYNLSSGPHQLQKSLH